VSPAAGRNVCLRSTRLTARRATPFGGAGGRMQVAFGARRRRKLWFVDSHRGRWDGDGRRQGTAQQNRGNERRRPSVKKGRGPRRRLVWAATCRRGAPVNLNVLPFLEAAV